MWNQSPEVSDTGRGPGSGPIGLAKRNPPPLSGAGVRHVGPAYSQRTANCRQSGIPTTLSVEPTHGLN